MRKRRGSVLATVLMLAMLLAIMTAVVANNTLSNYKATNWSADTGNSRYVAYAGIQHALIFLRDDPTYNTADTPIRGHVPGSPGVTYEVTVKNQRNLLPRNRDGSGGGTRFDTEEIPVDAAQIESKVLLADGRQDRSLAGMVGTAIWRPTAFENAAAASSLIAISGDSKTMAFNFADYDGWERREGKTDSFSGYVDPDPPGESDHRPPSSANVQSGKAIHIADEAKVEGDVIARPLQSDGDGGTVNPLPSIARALELIAPDLARAVPSFDPVPEEDRYTGEKRVPEADPEIAPASPPYARSEAVRNGSMSHFPATTYEVERHGRRETVTEPYRLEPKAYQNIHVPADQTLVLTPGRYYVSDEFRVDGKIEVSTDNRGDVLLFVGKKMVVNGEMNFEGNPAELQVYFTDEDKPLDENGDPIVGENGASARGFSTLQMNDNSKATMVVEGANLVARLDKARLLGAVSGLAVWLENGSKIEYDTNLKGRQMAGGSPWKLQGVYETVLR